MSEVWKRIPEFPTYEVSSAGRVRRFDTGRMLKLQIKHGYPSANLALGGYGNYVTRAVHGLVLSAFVGSRPDGHQCRHLNGIRSDNRIENLTWGTQSENEADKVRHGTNPIGSRNAAAKLTETQVVEIRSLVAQGLLRKQEIAKRFGVSPSNVSAILAGRSWGWVA